MVGHVYLELAKWSEQEDASIFIKHSLDEIFGNVVLLPFNKRWRGVVLLTP